MLKLKQSIFVILFLFSSVTVAKLLKTKLKFDPNEINPIDVDKDVAEICEEGQYYNERMNRCFDCTPCAEFSYEVEQCTKSENTNCVWCGNAGNVDLMSTTVLMSYQTKCLMTRLKFVNMKELDREIFNDKWTVSDENEEKSSEEDEDLTEQYIASKVSRYFTERDFIKSDLIDVNIADDLEEIPRNFKNKLTKEEVERMLSFPEDDDESSEEDEETDDNEDDVVLDEKLDGASNDRLIKWDDWVDDRVKPLIRERIKLIESQKDRPMELTPMDQGNDNVVIMIDAEEALPEEFEMEETENTKRTYERHVFIGILFIVSIVFALYAFRAFFRRPKTFRIVELHPEDYQILHQCGKYAEKKNYENSVRENPLYIP